MKKILIHGGRIWDGEKFFYADILTKDEKIVKISDKIYEDADIIFNAEGKTVSAGLVDAHMHMRGISSNQWGAPVDISCFPFGVTAACDAAGFNGDSMLLNSFMVKNTVFVCPQFNENGTDFNNTELMLKKYGNKAIGIKVFFDTSHPNIRDINPLKDVLAFARSNNLIVMVHSSNSPVKMADILSVLDKGDILTHAFHGGKNNASLDELESMKEAKQKGVVIDAGLAGCVHTDFSIFKSAIGCGVVPDIISTDITRWSAYTRGGRYGMTMCMSIAKTLGMCDKDIFRAVTSNPAKALGKDAEWGYLKVGRCADIAVLDYTNEVFNLTDNAGNNIHNSKGYRCILTLSNGQIVYKD